VDISEQVASAAGNTLATGCSVLAGGLSKPSGSLNFDTDAGYHVQLICRIILFMDYITLISLFW
jgi:hypothetical protein